MARFLFLVIAAQGAPAVRDADSPPGRTDSVPPEIASTHVEELPSCGVAATYAILHLCGRTVAVDEVTSRLSAIDPVSQTDRTSLFSIRQVLHDYGVTASSVRFARHRLRDVSPPAILVLRDAEADAADPAHFVVLHSFKDSHARIIDASRPGAASQVPVMELASTWDGTALLVSMKPTKRPLLLWEHALLLIASVQIAVLAYASFGIARSTFRARRRIAERH